jgi:hypothetical protein
LSYEIKLRVNEFKILVERKEEGEGEGEGGEGSREGGGLRRRRGLPCDLFIYVM